MAAGGRLARARVSPLRVGTRERRKQRVWRRARDRRAHRGRQRGRRRARCDVRARDGSLIDRTRVPLDKSLGVGRAHTYLFDRDVARIANISHVIVLEGINDIGNSGTSMLADNPVVAPKDLIAGYRQIIARAHLRGIKVVMGTLLPFEGAQYYAPEKELVRLAVNEWIRGSGEPDAVIDFDEIARDPEHPAKLAPLFDSGDNLHSGEEGYREAKDFMKMLMPSHAKVVQPYRDLHPIFARSGIEAQLDRMLQPQVTLKSGGYIIINQTEALVAIDVNSGRSTREHSIEDTALQTNLEAADEVARQLRLRDLAGLIVIDFIDMEENRNNRAVEKRMKDCLKNDRARIQVGRISHFGLLEMSRQRIRASVLESTMQVCPTCGGNGLIRSQSSVALHVLRGVEEHLLKNTTHDIVVRTTAETALYMLNHKRDTIVDLENRFGVSISFSADAGASSEAASAVSA